MQFLLAIGLPVAGGVWLDLKLETKAVFTLLGLALGFGSGFYLLYNEIYKKPDRSRTSRRDDPEDRQDGQRDDSE